MNNPNQTNDVTTLIVLIVVFLFAGIGVFFLLRLLQKKLEGKKQDEHQVLGQPSHPPKPTPVIRYDGPKEITIKEAPVIKQKFFDIETRLSMLVDNNSNAVIMLNEIADQAEILSKIIASIGRRVASLKREKGTLLAMISEIEGFTYAGGDFKSYTKVVRLAGEAGSMWVHMAAIPVREEYTEAWRRLCFSASVHAGTLDSAIVGYDNLGLILADGHAEILSKLLETERRLTLAEAQVPILKIHKALESIEGTMYLFAPQFGPMAQALIGNKPLMAPSSIGQIPSNV